MAFHAMDRKPVYALDRQSFYGLDDQPFHAIDRKPVAENSTFQVPQRDVTDECVLRTDDSGIWNACKAWYLFFLHLATCGFFVLGIVLWIDDRTFHTGSPPTWFEYRSGLYQTQITGLISLGLVGIRILGGTCTVLLAWRVVFILLEKRGVSLAEITRLSSWRIPVSPQLGSKSQILWSCWALLVIFLSWPPGLSAPLLSSSVAWIPSTRLLKDTTQTSVEAVNKYLDWASLMYPETLMLAVVRAAAMTGKDPSYVFNSTGLPLRRYFDSTDPDLTTQSQINLTVPYFDVGLKWIDATAYNQTGNIGYPDYIDVNNNSFATRDLGAVAIMRDSQFNGANVRPEEAETFVGKKVVVVKLQTLAKGQRLDDGTIVDKNTPCPTTSNVFGRLPAVSQYQGPIVWDDANQTWAANDCYILAEASITAGKHTSANCTVSPAGSIDRYATCTMHAGAAEVEDDWLTGLALDFVSETLKYTVMQNFTYPYMNGSIDQYTSGMLTLGYHAAWCGLMKRLGNWTEHATYRQAEPVVQAQIARSKLYGWLGMNITLAVSALLVCIAQSISKTKTIRDTAIAAMTMDLTEVAHSGRANGLCNAVALSKRDGKLPKLKWKAGRQSYQGETGSFESFEEGHCRRRLVFMGEGEDVSRRTVEGTFRAHVSNPTQYERI